MTVPKTQNLGLNKIDRSAPGTTTFNLKTYLEDNWDALDAIIPIHAMARQAIINGNFDIWQRGTSFNSLASPAFTYTADRWSWAYDGTGQVATVSKQDFAAGQVEVPNNPASFLRMQVTTAAAGQGYNSLQQKIESVRSFAGEKLTVSFWAKADVARAITAYMHQHFGSGGSATISTPSVNLNLTAVWQKFVVTFDIPSIAGKTVGANNFLAMIIGMPVSSVCTVDIAQVQINTGDVALPFQTRSFADELRRCQRYLFRLQAIDLFASMAICQAIDTANALANIPVPVTLRITPTLTYGGALRLISPTGTTIGVTSLSIGNSTLDTISIGIKASGLVGGNAYILSANADTSAYIGFDAEL